MYLRSAEITNIRSLKNFGLEFDDDEYAGWHVLIGDNGSGKTTIVRAIALGLIGEREAAALRQNWDDWLRHGDRSGMISLVIRGDDAVDQLDEQTAESDGSDWNPVLSFHHFDKGSPRTHLKQARVIGCGDRGVLPFRSESSGWFCASYGPFRRFSGGSRENEVFDPRVARHLTAFGEDAALTECLDWLKDLKFKSLEENPAGDLLEDVKRFINEGHLLPHDTVLEKVSSDAVLFRDGNGCLISVEQLSDGYRSMLSMTFELIRQMTVAYGPDLVFERIRAGEMKIDLPGVVLIDEIDAHLHPTWQRRVGHWFRQYFPKVQFIVTTHSPLVCQAAEEGSVWRLPTPGDDSTAGRVTGVELQRLIYGNVLDAYGTELFGADVTRSDSSQEKLEQLARLNRKSLRAELSAEEKQEQEELRATLPTAAGTLAEPDGE